MLRICLFPLLLLACLGGLPAHAEEGAGCRTDELDARTAKALEAHAAWCQKKKLYGKRDAALAELLRFDADHEEARRRLKYKRDADGAWTQDPRYKPARNLTRAGLEEADARLAAIQEAHLAAVIERLGQARTIPQIQEARRRLEGLERTSPGRKDVAAVLRDLALRYYRLMADRGLAAEVEATGTWLQTHHPRDLEVRSALGLVAWNGRLVLAETARSLRDAVGLQERLAKARTGKVVDGAPNDYEKKIDLPWTTPRATPHVRVAGTAETKHLTSVASGADGLGLLFEKALGVAPKRRKDLIVYVFAEEGQRDLFLAGYPVRDNPTLALKEKLDLVYADGLTLAVRAVLPAAQLDLIVNEVGNQMISDTFLESRTPRAWHAEGIARYLAWRLLGTRYAINVSGSYAGQSKDRAIPDTKVDWLAKARAHLAKQPAGLQLLLGKGTDVFTVRDALVAFAFSVYLLEGHPGMAGSFVRLHEQTKDVDRTCREILGMRRTIVEQRLKRWLDEKLELASEASEDD